MEQPTFEHFESSCEAEETSKATSDKSSKECPKETMTFSLWPKRQFLFELDYAVREQIKRKLQGQLSREMDHFVSKGMTFDQLKEIQKELELCPSVLEYYPGKRNFLMRWWYRITNALSSIWS